MVCLVLSLSLFLHLILKSTPALVSLSYLVELSNDPIIRSHLSALYDTLLEQNLVRIIEPFSSVEIAHVAELVGQPVQGVETKFVQLILHAHIFSYPCLHSTEMRFPVLIISFWFVLRQAESDDPRQDLLWCPRPRSGMPACL